MFSDADATLLSFFVTQSIGLVSLTPLEFDLMMIWDTFDSIMPASNNGVLALFSNVCLVEIVDYRNFC